MFVYAIELISFSIQCRLFKFLSMRAGEKRRREGVQFIEREKEYEWVEI